MKKPETPKPDTTTAKSSGTAPAKDASDKKASETISIDSKGNASVSETKGTASATSASANTSKPGTAAGSSSKSGATSGGTGGPSGAAHTGTSTSNTAKSATSGPSGKAEGSAPRSGTNGPSKPSGGSGTSGGSGNNAGSSGSSSGAPARIVLWAVVIVGLVLAVGWASRSLWWQQAEPALSGVLPQSAMEALAPAGTEETGLISGDTTANPSSSQSPTVTNNGNDQTAASNDTSSDTAAGDQSDQPSSAMDSPDTSQTDQGSTSTPDETASDTTALGQIAMTENGPATASTSGAGENGDQVVVSSDIAQRLSQLEGTISALQDRLNEQRGNSVNTAVAKRLGELEAKSAPIDELNRFETELSGVAKQMRDLSGRLAKVEDEMKATAGLRIEGRGQAIGIAVAMLRDAAARGGPFQIALSQLERAGSNDPVVAKQLETLSPLAAQGAPTLEQLRQDFPGVADDAVRAATDDHSGGIWQSTVANLKKLFPIRRVDATGEDSLDGRLARAENALKANDLQTAIAALDGISGANAKQAVEPWLNRAKARATVNQAISTLSSHSIGLLTPAEKSAETTKTSDDTGNSANDTAGGNQ